MLQTIQSTRIARFGSGGAIMRSPAPLTDEQILRAAPSVFAREKHISRSEKYTYIPTSEVLAGMRKEGFMPYEVRQGGSRDEMKRGFTKHMIRFRREGVRQVGDSLREIILLNAHDGTSSYRLMSGLFRLVCSNGLVVADGHAEELRIPHKGNIIDNVIEGAFQVIENGDAIDSAVENMRTLQLTGPEQLAFAESAALLRFEDGKVPVAANDVNAARRGADQGGDMWTTFNRVQENLVQGGLGFWRRPEPNSGRRASWQHTRPVNSIDGNVNLNRALWTLATRMGELKNTA